MLRDLAGEDPGAIDADVLVVGGGTVGLLLAARLGGRGRKVVVLESGGRSQDSDTHPLNEVVQQGQAYQGAAHGRFRCLGGTSTRWGGAMLPFLPEDMQPSPATGNARWGTATYADVIRYLPEAERLFALPGDDYVATDVPIPADFSARLAKWPRFKARNTAALVGDCLASDRGPDVWLNATVVGFSVAENGRLAGVTARAPGGRTLQVAARTTVLAAGAIESTRLLLLLDAQGGGRVSGPNGVLGRHFSDHLSAPVADIEPHALQQFREIVGFRFQGAVMRNLRYELQDAAREREGLPAAFLHLAVVADESSGFAALRDVFRKVQRRSLPSLQEMARLAGNAPWLTQALWWRLARNRLLAPADARFEAHMVTEQVPDGASRITLSPDRKDMFGVPLAVIDWRVSEADISHHQRVSRLFFCNWSASPLAHIASLALRPEQETAAALTQCGGVFHPTGSARIGSGPADGVVDGGLKTFAVPNLRVLSTAAFPTGGTANPTLMLILFGLRAADQIHADLG